MTWRKRPTTFWSTTSSTPRMRICAAGTASHPGPGISSMKLRASALHLPPVSRATSTRRHLSAATSLKYLASLSRRAWVRMTPSTTAACHPPGHSGHRTRTSHRRGGEATANRSRTKVRKRRSCTWNGTAAAPGPEWDRKWA